MKVRGWRYLPDGSVVVFARPRSFGFGSILILLFLVFAGLSVVRYNQEMRRVTGQSLSVKLLSNWKQWLKVAEPIAALPTQIVYHEPIELGTTVSKTYFSQDPRSYIPYKNGVEQLPQNIGKTATLTNMNFNKNAVRECQGRCSITFSDHFGRSVTGIFFRSSQVDRLLASGGKVSISGLVQQSEDGRFTMFVNRVL